MLKMQRMLPRVAALGIAALALAIAASGATRCLAKESKKFSDYDSQVKPLVERMTLEEKIGQMTQPELGYVEQNPGDIERYFVGSVLSGGGSDPKAGNSLEAWTDAYDLCQKHALKTRLAIPILYGVDAVHGHSNVLGAVIFPHNIGLGCANDPELTDEINRITAAEMRATGINWNFAPCVTVPRDERWGRTYEGFGECPKLVGPLGEAAVVGLQGERLSDPLSVLACAKHYVGDGGTKANTGQYQQGTTAFGEGVNGVAPQMKLDQGDTQADEKSFREVHLSPYAPAIEAGVGTVMPSYSSWNGEKCTGNKYLLTDVLKGELGFEGFVISDYNAIDQLDKDYDVAVVKAVNAGVDMAMAPNTYKQFFTSLKKAVDEGKVPVSRIDDAVTRILRVKAAMGMLESDHSQLADRSLHESFGSQEHRAVAREAVRKSLVLLKNNDDALPLAKTAKRIHLAGSGANNVGNQCGGWTIEWQGKSGDVTSGGTTILEAVKNTASNDTDVTFSKDGTGAAGADVAIVVVGEQPYAEGNGDSGDLALSADDVAAVKNAKSAGVPVVVVLLSGRPMMIESVLEDADAFVAAWLPGTEGQGVADVLFGDFAPEGKLSVTWPRTVAQLPINVGDSQYDPLFPFGYGLTYVEEATASAGGR